MADAPFPASSLDGVDALLNPRSVAIVGATPRVDALGGRPIVNLRTQGYEGNIFPVNPRHDSILGLKCYADLRALPQSPDIVLVLVGQDRVFEVLDEALAVGARTALVFGGGFAEMSGDGIARQQRLKAYATQGLRICGPNCNGVFSVVNRAALGFSPSFELPARRGNIALVAQSGNVSTCVSSRGVELGLGFSHLIASGNEADLEMSDYVEYLLDDPATDVFALFVEGFKDPARFLRVAEEALRRGKPIVLMKMGRTASSQRVALSHTGAMTGEYRVITGALRQKGVIVVERMDELCAVAAVLAAGRRPQGGAVAVASLSGGMAGVIADACQELEVPLARLAPHTAQRISAQLPGVASLDNPLDMTGQVVNEPDCWTKCVDILARDPAVDVLVSVLSITANQIERRFAQDLVELRDRTAVLQVCIWPSGAPAGSGFEVLRDAGLVVQLRVEDAIGAVAHWRHYWCTRDARIAAIDAHRTRPAAPSASASWRSGWELLEQAGIATARQVLVTRREELVEALAGLQLPVALKVESAAIAHKTELNAMRLNVGSTEQALLAYDDITAIAARHTGDRAPAPVLVQEMHGGRRELILGLKQESGVGTAVLLGIGGIFSEVLQDVSVRVAPVTGFDALEMVSELRGRSLLRGARGLAPVPDALIADLVTKLSDLALRCGETLAELDVNPLIVRDDGQAGVAVDVLVRPPSAPVAPAGRSDAANS
jgi:acetate---CoA ligase (ADP-forming)